MYRFLLAWPIAHNHVKAVQLAYRNTNKVSKSYIQAAEAQARLRTNQAKILETIQQTKGGHSKTQEMKESENLCGSANE